MLEELRHFENLGSPTYFCELFGCLADQKTKWTVADVRDRFYNKTIEGRTVFDGCLPLAQMIGALQINEEGVIIIDSKISAFPNNEKYLCHKFLEKMFSSLQNDDVFHTVFSPLHLSYDIIYRSPQISIDAFGLRYTNFKRLLIDFGFLQPHPDHEISKLFIDAKFKKLFDTYLLPDIKKRKTGLDELRKILEQKQEYGEQAEIFVVDFEKRRLSGSPKAESVEKISDYDVSAGYDIVSYDGPASSEYDRFIEVKSFTEDPSFYWSRNEMDVAKVKRDRYFLYLVDRDKMNEDGFVPIIIQNPYTEVIKNETKWHMRPEKYFVSLR